MSAILKPDHALESAGEVLIESIALPSLTEIRSNWPGGQVWVAAEWPPYPRFHFL